MNRATSAEAARIELLAQHARRLRAKAHGSTSVPLVIAAAAAEALVAVSIRRLN